MSVMLHSPVSRRCSRTLLFVGLVLALVGKTASADNLVTLHAGYTSAFRAYDAGAANVDVSVGGFGVHSVSFVGGDVGLLSSGGIFLPTACSIGASAESFGIAVSASVDCLDLYSGGLLFAADIGPGWRFEFEQGEIIVGPGVRFNGVALYHATDPFLSYALGAGAQATVLFSIGSGFVVSAGGTLGYDFLEFVKLPELPSDIHYAGGFSWSISAGIGFLF